MKFWKMNGAGNDFVIINNMDGAIDPKHYGIIAKTLCERHMSIGADGMMFVEKPHGEADYRMAFYNSDGSQGEMCGNGARCICRFGYETGLAGEVQTVETTAGVVIGQRINERLYRIRLNDPSVLKVNYPVELDGTMRECSYVELGNPGIPHAVVPISGLTDFPERLLFDLGRKLRYHEAFPKGANVNFYEITGEDEVFERTYERGVEDFTYACGTGTGSLVSVLTLKGLVSGKNVKVNMTGGQLIIDIDREGDVIRNLYLTGPTNMVCCGEVTDEDLSF
ncbi:MAG: diaminopimelate epimerase [Ruminococcaceae bacterium]|nr:diaminopimelate epimerase [Oscillospiraceae bacterium]